MKKFVALSALGLAAAAGSAYGQDFRLDLRLVAREYQPDESQKADFQTGGVINSLTPVTYEIEVRYRIADLTSDTRGSRGLVSAVLRQTFSGGGAFSLSRANLTIFQFDKPTAGFTNSKDPTAGDINPDTTGRNDGGDPGSNGFSTGLHGPYRDGLNGDDNDPGNGSPTAGGPLDPAGFEFVPLTLSAPGQNSWASGANPSTSNTNTNATAWGLFSFVITVTSGTVNLNVDAVADPGTGNKFAFFRRSGATNESAPVESNLSSAGTLTITVVPAPASAALLGLGGLLVARRRRA